MNLRFKQVRESKGLSQQEFAKRLGLQRNSISLIETGNRNPSDRTINDVCKIFRINECWLRTGEGKMPDLTSVDAIEELAELFTLDEVDKDIIYSYVSIPTFFRKSMRTYIKALLETSSETYRLEDEESKLKQEEVALHAKLDEELAKEKKLESEVSSAKESDVG